MPSGGVGSKTMSGIKQSQARGLKIDDPARRAQTTFIALPLVFALFLSSGYAQESPKHPEEDHSLSSGWASSKFNDIYIGLSKWCGAEGSLATIGDLTYISGHILSSPTSPTGDFGSTWIRPPSTVLG